MPRVIPSVVHQHLHLPLLKRSSTCLQAPEEGKDAARHCVSSTAAAAYHGCTLWHHNYSPAQGSTANSTSTQGEGQCHVLQRQRHSKGAPLTCTELLRLEAGVLGAGKGATWVGAQRGAAPGGGRLQRRQQTPESAGGHLGRLRSPPSARSPSSPPPRPLPPPFPLFPPMAPLPLRPLTALPRPWAEFMAGQRRDLRSQARRGGFADTSLHTCTAHPEQSRQALWDVDLCLSKTGKAQRESHKGGQRGERQGRKGGKEHYPPAYAPPGSAVHRIPLPLAPLLPLCPCLRPLLCPFLCPFLSTALPCASWALLGPPWEAAGCTGGGSGWGRGDEEGRDEAQARELGGVARERG